MATFSSDNPFGDPSGGDNNNANAPIIRNKNPFDDSTAFGSSTATQPPVRPGGYGTTTLTSNMPTSGAASSPILSPMNNNNAPATLLPSSTATTPSANEATTPWYGGDTSVNIAAGKMPADELERRQRELENRAAELDRRERALGSGNPRLHNWPPLPSWSPIGACFYQDIEVEIPVEFQRTTRFAYLTWLAYAATLLINVVVQVCRLFILGMIVDFVMSIFWTIIFIPLSYTTWFRPIYKAFRADSSFNFFVFFFVFFAQLLVAIVQCIGIGFSGFAGWSMVRAGFASNIFIGIICTITAIMFTSLVLADIVVLQRVHRIYQGSSATWEKAQSEFSGNMMRNPHVQQAAAGAARSAVSSAFTNATAAGGRTTGGGQPQRF